MSRRVRLMMLVTLLAACASPSIAAACQSQNSVGRRLVNRYLSDLERRDIADLRRFVSPAFQVERGDGLRQTKNNLLRHPPRVRSYTIRKLRVTTHANVLVATFEMAASEVIHGKSFHAKYAPRLAVFVAVAKGWRLIGYANFNAPR